MPSFYFPFKTIISGISIIVYPMVGVEKLFDRTEIDEINKHLQNLYNENPILESGLYHIAIIWEDSRDRMVDVWIFSGNESDQSGPVVVAHTFRNLSEDKTMGTTAADGLIMLGRETELEEQMRKSGKSIDEYINAERPKLPDSIKPVEGFYRD